MPEISNIFAEIPANLSDEVFQTLLASPNVRIERIVSFGHASPEGFWYDQETDEWVLLLAGAVPRRSWVAAVSPTFGRLFEGTDEPSLGQTWPGPIVPLTHSVNAFGERSTPTRPRQAKPALSAR